MKKETYLPWLKRALVALGAIALIALVSNSRFFMPAEEEALAPPLKKPEPVTYDTYETALIDIENTLSCRGYFQARNEVDVSFKNREGYLKKLYVTGGDRVKAGQLLASLDTEDLERDLATQRLETRGAEENVAKLKKLSAIDLDLARMELEDLDKNRQLLAKAEGSVAGHEIVEAERLYQKQKIAVTRLEADSAFQLSEAERQLELERLAQAKLEDELGRSGIYAPISGTAAFVAFINEGEYVPAYKTVVTVADTRSLVLQYQGEDNAGFAVGMPVRVSYRDRQYEGTVILTPRQVPPDEYEKMKEIVLIGVKNLPSDCAVGDSATVEARLDWAENVIALPKRLVHKYGGRAFVKVLKDGLVSERDVSVGIESATEYEISEGLEPGELVVE